jgi:hypothetical protein
MRRLLLVVAISFLGACAADTSEPAINQQPLPADPQPAAAALKDGLATHYYGASYDTVDEFVSWLDYREGYEGLPINGLEHRAGKGDVLTSGSKNQVGALITGFLLIPEGGSYQLSVTTNDGIRIHLGGARIHNDPKVGPDRTVESAAFQITQAGWYPLKIWYFEKRGTSTMEILWKTPQSGSFKSISAGDLKHL